MTQNSRLMAAGVTQVNPVQAQQGKACRVGFGRAPVVAFERLMQVVATREGGVAPQLPIVEVAGNDDRSIVGQGFEQLAEQL
ncbi:hypothetical protein D3C86_2173540 [compost metagenome]